jgi:hypothetical protein
VEIVDGWDHALPPRREQLDDENMGLILQEVKAGHHLEWKDIADCTPVYKREDIWVSTEPWTRLSHSWS